jgi:hypothetical protein
VEAFFASGAAVDVVLAVIALEFLALVGLAPAGRRATTALNLAFTLAPGALILLALRAALTGEGWMTIAFWLAASFPVHIMDLVRRRA